MSQNLKTYETQSTVKSQLMQARNIQEPESCSELRALIDNTLKDNSWYSQCSKQTNLSTSILKDHNKITKNWNDNWGKLKVEYNVDNTPTVKLTWIRPDNGPDIIDISTRPLNERMIIRILQSLLIKELKENSFLSYVQLGFPYWNQCKIYCSGLEISHIKWACAILGYCEVQERTTSGFVDKQLKGRIIIPITEEIQTFF